MAVNLSGWGTAQSILWTDNTHKDAQDKDEWSLRIKGQLANPGLPGKWQLKGLCECEIEIHSHLL